jgi:hypothetical protein
MIDYEKRKEDMGFPSLFNLKVDQAEIKINK